MDVSIQVTQDNGVERIFYQGPINEDAEVHLTNLVKTAGPNCAFNFKNVSFVNSCGVRAWINFMRDFEKGRKIVFEECTPEIVLQINMIPSFKGQAKIASVYGQYSCGSCGHKQRQLFVEGHNLPHDGNYPEVKCEKCAAATEMEELEDEFFAFAAAA
jgi:hypothetical protein